MSKKTKKPKIEFLIPRLGITDRGAEVFVYELVKRLRNNFDVTIFTRANVSHPSPMIKELMYTNGIHVLHVNSPGASIKSIRWLCRHTRLKLFTTKLHIDPDEMEMLLFCLRCLPHLLFKKNDLLFPVNGVWGALFCHFVRAVRGIPYVYSSQGGREPLIALLKPDTYFAIHQSTKIWLNQYFPNLRAVYVPNGVNLDRFRPNGEKVQLNLPRPIFVTAAALVSHKQVDLTIKAVSRLRKGSLLILGAGPLRGELRKLADEELGRGRYKILSVGNLQVPKYLRTADVFTLAAPWEIGIGLVQTEAMACGLPVVCNDGIDIKRMIGKAGLVCDVKNTSEYARALWQAWQTNFNDLPQIQAQIYSWERIAAFYEEELSQIL